MEKINNRIEIRPIGSYFEKDKDGYLINPTSLEKIQEEWKPVTEEVVDIYKEQFGDKLSSVYIRGSVAKGEAIRNISDVDTFAYVDLSKEEIQKEWIKEKQEFLKNKYPFATKVELSISPLFRIKNDTVKLNGSLCVFGENIDVPKVKADRNLILHLPNLNKRIGNFEERLKLLDSSKDIKNACVWFMKDILRSGFELTIEESGNYTRDLYFSYKDISKYYPDKEPLMREVLDLALNPTDSKIKIEDIKSRTIPWLAEEYKIKYIDGVI